MTASRHTASDRVRRLALADASVAPLVGLISRTPGPARRIPGRRDRRAGLRESLSGVRDPGRRFEMTDASVKLEFDREPGRKPTDEDLQRVAEARQAGGDFIRGRWPGFEDLACAMDLMITELLSNALLHGDGKVTAELRYAANENEIRLVVTDESGELPCLASCADPTAVSGRGLHIVECFAQEQRGRLAVIPAASGKAVICTIPAPGSIAERRSA
ncbi:hypothetical protein DMH18_26765 [Streptomyces sp. WAC 06783]|uniref:ATP-binding protein n=1 Tax=Streptomyces sp. WAC 06783 TaxID=2203211 RepID=UPI000F735EEC|nr:ATP-binding protein [Streptomyces sp. WAC 06783]RSO07038.1 hypothetical protein DMH18_26765 [Streptomyces sp. WAC 06783]